MCGRYVTVTKIAVLEKLFGAKVKFDFKKNFNAAPSQQLPVITNQSPTEIQGFNFGYLPPWAKGKYKFLINIKAESILKQGENSRNYYLLLREKVLESRCVVLANCFIEWSSKDKQPYAVYVQGNHNILFAGIHTTWIDKSTGEVINSFGIITQEGNELMQKIGHHRQPLILTPDTYQNWLNCSNLSDVSHILNDRMPPASMNAYPIDPKLINSPVNNNKEVIQPVGERVAKEYEIEVENHIELFGMGQTRARMRKDKL